MKIYLHHIGKLRGNRSCRVAACSVHLDSKSAIVEREMLALYGAKFNEATL